MRIEIKTKDGETIKREYLSFVSIDPDQNTIHLQPSMHSKDELSIVPLHACERLLIFHRSWFIDKKGSAKNENRDQTE